MHAIAIATYTAIAVYIIKVIYYLLCTVAIARPIIVVNSSTSRTSGVTKKWMHEVAS